MAVINIRMLNYNLKEQIEMGRLSEENVAMVREKVKAGNKTALIGYIVFADIRSWRILRTFRKSCPSILSEEAFCSLSYWERGT